MRVVPLIAMRVAANGTGCQFSSKSAVVGKEVAHRNTPSGVTRLPITIWRPRAGWSDIEIGLIPIDEAGDALFDGGGRRETKVAHACVDIGVGL